MFYHEPSQWRSKRRCPIKTDFFNEIFSLINAYFARYILNISTFKVRRLSKYLEQ